VNELVAGIEDGSLGGRLWLYSNYHCNLTCAYCLTASSPKAPRRALPPDRMVELARQAAELGFTSVGVTGGEPFLIPEMPETLARMAAHLPVLVLSNATLFTDKLLARLAPLADLPVTAQVSLDSADADDNDRNRADGNFSSVVAAIPRLLAAGLAVRVATTGAPADDEARARLCALHSELGISDADHVTRPIVRRGRAGDNAAAVPPSTDNLFPELTVTAEGAYWSPFAPTITGGRTDTDLLICRVTEPLQHAVEHLLHIVGGRPPGAGAVAGIP